MNIREVKKLYRSAVEGEVTDSEGDYWWQDVRREMELVVAAKSDRSAARVIAWWGCWDRKLTAISVARKVRQTWALTQGEQLSVKK